MNQTLGFGSSSNAITRDGIFIDEAKVIELIDNTDEDNERTMKLDKPFKNDVALVLKVKLLKNDWEKIVTISGNYKKEPSPDPEGFKILDWGGAFKVRDLFLACGIEERPEVPRPDKAMLETCVGEDILVLSYPTKKGKNYMWNQVTKVNRDKADFKKYFLRSALNPLPNKRFPKDYKPVSTDPQPTSPRMQEALNSTSVDTDLL